MRSFALSLVAVLALSTAGKAQVTEPQLESPPPAHTESVRITFIPPPMEGTISLGVYDSAGKLVRVLKREALPKDFIVGLNGLITAWDGKDDAGVEVAAGKYDLRGYSVGVLDVEGIAYHCNEWVSDEESPRIKRLIPRGGFSPDGTVTVRVELADQRRGTVQLKPEVSGAAETGKIVFQPEALTSGVESPDASRDLPTGAMGEVEIGRDGFAFGGGKMWRKKPGGEWSPADLPGLQRPVHACAGVNTLWVIDADPAGAAVKEYSPEGEPLRELIAAAGEPVPVWMDAKGRDEIVLLEESATEQRIRILSRSQDAAAGKAAETATSNWKTLASRTIRFSETFPQVSAALGRPDPVQIEEQVKVRLLPNPLFKDVATELTISLGFDQNGAFLRSSDGLPLVGVTETSNLRWAVMTREKGSKALTIFQGDGAVVEEFRVGKLANMMAFDAGDCDWPPHAKK